MAPFAHCAPATRGWYSLRELPEPRSADARIIPHQQDAEESEGSRNRAAYHEAAAMTRYPI
jgi:hypothetical protein